MLPIPLQGTAVPGGPPAENRLIKIDEVVEISGYGKSILYKWMRDGSFPRPCKPGGAGSRWSLHEVRAWRDEKLAARAA